MIRPVEFDPIYCGARECKSEGTRRWKIEADEGTGGWIFLCPKHHEEAKRARLDRPDPRQMSLPHVP